jgi:hypothetical protein
VTARLSGRSSLAAVIAALALSAVLSACGGSDSPAVAGPSGHTRTPSSSATPTVLPPGKRCHAALGGTVVFRDPVNHITVKVQTGRVHVYSGRLATYASAYPPSYGYFVKIPIHLTDVGPLLWQIQPSWFVLHAGGRALTVESGNGPYSGASHQLVATFLDPGDTDKTNVVIDTPSPHGKLVYAPKGHTVCSWTV